MRRAPVSIAALALALLFPSPAAGGEGFSPPKAPVVAGPTESGARLVAFDRRGALCTALLERRQRSGYPDCERRTPSLHDPRVHMSGTSRRVFVSGVVTPEVAAVELVPRRGEPVRVPASTGGYAGRYADGVRFFLIEARAVNFFHPGYLRLFRADGSLLAVAERFGAGRRVSPLFRIDSGRRGGTRWTLRGYLERRVAPIPSDEERMVTSACVEIRRHAGACRNPDFPHDEADIGIDQDCGPLGLTVVGFAGEGTRRVVAVLGDGRRLRAGLRPLPPRLGAGRAFALVLGADVALRRLVAFGPGGRREVLTDAVGPGRIRCNDNALVAFAFAFGSEPLPHPDVPPSLQLREQGALLCTTLTVFDPRGRDCRYPPLTPIDSVVLRHSAAGRTVVAGVVPGEVPAVVVHLDGGERRYVETAPARPDGLFRSFVVDVPGERLGLAVRMFDVRGRTLLTYPGPDDMPIRRGPVELLRGPGRLRLHGYVPEPRRGPPRPCLATGGPRIDIEDGCATFPGLTALAARCRPRQLVLSGMVRAGTGAPVVLTDGRAVRARSVGLRRALGVPGRAWLAVIPGRLEPQAVIARRRGRTHRRVLHVPPAASQCGYDDTLFLF